jgi:ribosome-associated protein
VPESPSLHVDPPGISIPRDELQFRATRAGGPGGQNVNKVASRVELLWDFSASSSLDDVLKHRIATKLARRLDAEGRLRIVATEERSQLRNREVAEERLVELLVAALRVPKKRKATKPTAASKERRLRQKRQRSDTKRARRRPYDE